MTDFVNKVHVSPGIYATETVDMKTAANSIGVTKLGLVGETLKGPAFQPYWIHSPKEFNSVFGGTSTEKFKGNGYPKYELPYIANEFLKEGTELCVVKTLGLSGYNAGPAWAIKGLADGKEYIIAVLRSRGGYKYRPEFAQKTDANGCECAVGNDLITFDVGESSKVTSCEAPVKYNMKAVSLSDYHSMNSDYNPCSSTTLNSVTVGFEATPYNLGKFTIVCYTGTTNVDDGSMNEENKVLIPVSLNKVDKDYILNVLGMSNDDGDMPLFVETLYDVAWESIVNANTGCTISRELVEYNVSYISDYGGIEPVYGFLTMTENELKKKDLGKRFLYSTNNGSPENITYHVFDYDTKKPELDGTSAITATCQEAYIYTVSQISNNDGSISYVYKSYSKNSLDKVLSGNPATLVIETGKLLSAEETQPDLKISSVVLNNEDNLYYTAKSEIGTIISPDSEVIVSGNVDITTGFTLNEGNIITIPNTGGTSAFLYFQNPNGLTLFQQTDSGNSAVGMSFEQTNPYQISAGRYSSLYTTLTVSNSIIPTSYSKIGQLLPITTEQFTGGTICAYSSGTISSEESLVLKRTRNPSSQLILWEEVEPNTDAPYKTWTIDSEHVDYYYALYSTDRRIVGTNYQIGRYQQNKYFVRSTTIGETATATSYTLYSKFKTETQTNTIVNPVMCDVNDYKSQYRYSSTPWVVSNLKGDTKKIELNKLFRFHTISDGVASLSEVKISIDNIRPDTGEFDVNVRDYNDIDSNPVVLEAFRRCTMKPGKSFIGYRIGTIDGLYESKSKYITVEVLGGTAVENSVPAGFLGYSVPMYDGIQIDGSKANAVIAPMAYNTTYYDNIPKRKQYFGVSNISGYDIDYFTFKGNMSALEQPGFVTKGFHLDSRLNTSVWQGGEPPIIAVDGVVGYEFDAVGVNNRTRDYTKVPMIMTENDMVGSIYEDVKIRKFTMMFAGGFDGWDVYREERTNKNEYSFSSYKGSINHNTGNGRSFDMLYSASQFGIEGGAITSDYYATLAGVSLLKNPEEVDINLLATPGIDTINNTQLVSEIFDVVEDRADTFYIVTTPDKYAGSSDFAEDIPDVDEIASDFVDNELYSDYAATYYPWVKIEDNGEYIWLPVTRDVVRNLAESDNTNITTNLAPAGTNRGRVKAIRARKNLKNPESDTLYESSINPVRTYAQEGLVVMGQKTLRKEDDLMNRIDVRRMVLRLRKLISIACIGLIFEPYDNQTVKAFKTIIAGIMQIFMDNRAIEKWNMDVDDSQEMRDRLELGAVIYVKPIRALEYITLNFVVTNNDIYFNE